MDPAVQTDQNDRGRAFLIAFRHVTLQFRLLHRFEEGDADEFLQFTHRFARFAGPHADGMEAHLLRCDQIVANVVEEHCLLSLDTQTIKRNLVELRVGFPE